MYKVGDTVFIKENADKIQCDVLFADDMLKYLGQVAKVSHVSTDEEFYAPRYKLEGCQDETDGYMWTFSELWLEPYEETKYQDIDDTLLTEMFNRE